MANRQNWRNARGFLFLTSTPVLLAATGAFVALAILVRERPYLALDLKIDRRVQQIHIPGFHPLMKLLSWTGFPPQVFAEVGLILVYLAAHKRKSEAMVLATTTWGVALVATIIKKIVNRPRPSPELVQVVHVNLNHGGESFMAGHAQAYVIVFGFLSFLIWLKERPTALQKFTFGLFTSLILLIGPSRLYEGEHWFTDILGGYLFGLVGLILELRFYAYLSRRKD